jgi:hypothetical protein
VARLWNSRHSTMPGEWAAPGTIPEDWLPLLRDVGEAYLPYLHANALAWREGRRHFDFTVQNTQYRRLPVVQYRVWCRERLQQHYAALPESARPAVDAILRQGGALEPLLAGGSIPSGLYADTVPPLCRPRQIGGLDKLRRFVTGTHWQMPKLPARPIS